MAKATSSVPAGSVPDIPTVDPGELEKFLEAKPAEAEESGVRLIIEKYLVNRSDIGNPMKRVLGILYKGETHLVSEWNEIINRRMSRPAD